MSEVLFHDDHRKQVPVYGRDDIDSSLCVIYTAFGRLRHLCKNSRNIGGLPGICKVYRRMAAAHRHGGDGAWHALDGTDGYCACSAGTGSLVVRLHLYGGETMDGGRYGWNLIPRHNTILNYSGYQEGFSQLLSNRILYASLAVIAVSVTAWIYSQKRKGRMNIRGKISANRKSQSNA